MTDAQWLRKAYQWCAKRGVAHLHKDLAKLLKGTHVKAQEDGIIEGIRVGGAVAISAKQRT